MYTIGCGVGINYQNIAFKIYKKPYYEEKISWFIGRESGGGIVNGLECGSRRHLA